MSPGLSFLLLKMGTKCLSHKADVRTASDSSSLGRAVAHGGWPEECGARACAAQGTLQVGHDVSSGSDGEDHLGAPGPGQCGTSRRSTIPVCPGLEGFHEGWDLPGQTGKGIHPSLGAELTRRRSVKVGDVLGQMVAELLSQPREPVLGTQEASLRTLSAPTACSTAE